MKGKIHIAKPEHEVVYTDLIELIRRHAKNVHDVELLAVAANLVGKIVALQDQRVMTHEKAMEIILRNISIGNQAVVDELMKSKGNA